MGTITNDYNLMLKSDSNSSLALLRLLQLTSTNLPVGGYSFSQGLESACELGWVTSPECTYHWLALQIKYSLAYLDLPVLSRVYQAAQQQDDTMLQYWDSYLLASRETHELHQAEIAMGQALRRLMTSLDISCSLGPQCSFVAAFTVCAVHFRIEKEWVAYGYCWSWLENQTMAATKLVPLGQTQAQQLLGQLQILIPQSWVLAVALKDHELGASLPGVSVASGLHESQYSRLFRS